jgi:hypothetical protein
VSSRPCARRRGRDLRLLAVRRGGVDLRGLFAVHRQAVEPDAGAERRLAVALADLDVGVAVPAIAGNLPLPSEEGADDEYLPRLEQERLRVTVFVRGVRQPEKVFKEPDRVIGGGFVEHEPVFLGRRAIAAVTLTRQPHPWTCDDAPREHRGRVLVDAVTVRRRARRRLLLT